MAVFLYFILFRKFPKLSVFDKAPSGSFSPAQLRSIALQLVTSILFLQNHGLIHADIKGENVLLTSQIPTVPMSLNNPGVAGARVCNDERLAVKMTDFGNAIKYEEVRKVVVFMYMYCLYSLRRIGRNIYLHLHI